MSSPPNQESREHRLKHSTALVANAAARRRKEHPRRRRRLTKARAIEAAHLLDNQITSDHQGIARSVHAEGVALADEHIRRVVEVNGWIAPWGRKRIIKHFGSDTAWVVERLKLPMQQRRTELFGLLKRSAPSSAQQAIQDIESAKTAPPIVLRNRSRVPTFNFGTPNLRYRLMALFLVGIIGAYAAHAAVLPGVGGHLVDVALLTLISAMLIAIKFFELLIPAPHDLDAISARKIERSFRIFLLVVVCLATINDAYLSGSVSQRNHAVIRGVVSGGMIFILDAALDLFIARLKHAISYYRTRHS